MLSVETVATLLANKSSDSPAITKEPDAGATTSEITDAANKPMAADLAFHEGICEASGNETLLETWRSLIGRITIMVLNVGPQRMSQLQDADVTTGA